MINLEYFCEWEPPNEWKELKMKEHEEKIQREIQKEKERKKQVAKEKRKLRDRWKAYEKLYPHSFIRLDQ
jgi:hypothetical protein